MSISLQTNVDSLIAQQNLNTNRAFQSNTIQQLTSGYRINSSADDAAGLAIANGFRSTATELTQGVQNANNGISTLQIVDGGMNNISQMLDTMRTLATESASGTFTGNRGTLNKQFQSLLTEVDRESQSIGMNTGGQFAKSLSVYVGGGTSNTGALSTSNGTVTVDLSSSSVDTQALGLKGMQVVAGATDLSASSNSSVANIVGNNSNTTALSGYSEFDFAGPGFSDGSQTKVSVNLSGVTDINTLVTALNNGIQTAGTGNSASATAFANAGIVASVHTDASGGKELAFTSSTTAFQVGAGDQMANALMGNLASGSTGTAITSTVTGANTAAAGTAIASPANVSFQISGGGLTSPVTLNLVAGSSTTGAAITDITSQVAGNTALKAAGITVSGAAGSPLVFTDSYGNKMNVQVTGDTAGRLGFGSFVGDGTATDTQYTTIQGTALATATALGTAQLGFSIDGGASSGANLLTVDLNAGDATAATETGSVANGDAHSQSLTITIDGGAVGTVAIAVGSTTVGQAAANINTAAVGVTATVDSGGHLILTANAAGAHSIAVGGAAGTTFGLGATMTGASRSGQSIADALNSGFAASATLTDSALQASFSGGKLTIASTNGTSFRVNAGGSAAGADVGFGVAGASFTGSTIGNSAATFDDASGASNSGALSFTPMKYGGDTQAITISANSASGALESKTITLQNNALGSTGQSIDAAVVYINKQLQQSNDPTLQSIAAVKENVSGTEKINFISSLSNFSVSAGNAANGDGFTDASVSGNTLKSSLNGTAATVSIDTQASAVQAVAAVANAVTKLGNAQAGVGEGQNQLNYATGLAQSQITNFSAAESRIRDANVAQEAANLTKAQTLSQAGIAAMAQANTEGQAILSLLHG